MTTQQIADRVVHHLLTQNKRATVEFDYPFPFSKKYPTCRYRTPDDLKCAVGCLLPDDRSRVSVVEGYPVDSNAIKTLIDETIGRPLTFNEIALLVRFQGIHDQVEVADWPTALQGLCEEYDLVFNPPAI